MIINTVYNEDGEFVREEPFDADIELDKLYPTEQTNEDFLRTATRQQLAEWIVHLADDCTMQHECNLCNSWCDEKRVMEWLKQPHTEEER